MRRVRRWPRKVARRRHSIYAESGLMDRLRLYAAALTDAQTPVSLTGLLEAALWEYLEARCDRAGVPRQGASPEVRIRYPGRGRPSAAARNGQFFPTLASASAQTRRLRVIRRSREPTGFNG